MIENNEVGICNFTNPGAINFLEKNEHVEVLGTLYNMLVNDEIYQGPHVIGQYEKNEDINFEELKTELSKVLSKAMYEEAQSRGMIDKMEKKIKQTNWK